MSHLRVAVETKTGLLGVVGAPAGKTALEKDFRSSLVAASTQEFGEVKTARAKGGQGTAISASGQTEGGVEGPSDGSIGEAACVMGGRVTYRAAPDGRSVVDLPAEDEAPAEEVVAGAVAKDCAKDEVSAATEELPVQVAASTLPVVEEGAHAKAQGRSVRAKADDGAGAGGSRLSVMSDLSVHAPPLATANLPGQVDVAVSSPTPAVAVVQVVSGPQSKSDADLRPAVPFAKITTKAKNSIAEIHAEAAPEKLSQRTFADVVAPASDAKVPVLGMQSVSVQPVKAPPISTSVRVVAQGPLESVPTALAEVIGALVPIVQKPLGVVGKGAAEPAATEAAETTSMMPAGIEKAQSVVVKKIPAEAKDGAAVGLLTDVASAPVATTEKNAPQSVTAAPEKLAVPAHAAAQEAVFVNATVAAPVVPIAAPHVPAVTTLSPTHVAEPVPAAAQTFEPRTLVATQQSLEVGVATGTHGWLRVRAEMGGTGEVVASVVASSVGAAESLHRALPGLHEYLAQEQVGVASVAVSSPAASAQNGLAAGVDSQSSGQPRREAEATQPASASQGWNGQDAEGATDVLELPFLYARAGGGSWVNVRV